MIPTMSRCKAHPKSSAGWRCDWCHAELCPDCTARQTSGAAIYDVCCLCGGPARELRRPRAAISFFKRLKGVYSFPLCATGIFSMVAAGVVLYLLSFLGGRGEAIGQAILWSYVLSIARRTGLGKTDHFEPPDFSGLSDLFRPALLGLVATSIIWLPAAGYVVWRIGSQAAEEQQFAYQERRAAQRAPAGQPDESVARGEEADSPQAGELSAPPDPARPRARPLLQDPVLWLLALLGTLYAPMALLIAVAGGGVLEMLNPIRILASIVRVPRDHFVLVGACLGMVVVQWQVADLQDSAAGWRIPVVSALLISILSTYLPFVLGRIIGVMLYVHGSELGFLPPSDADEPAANLGQPRGNAPPPSTINSSSIDGQIASAEASVATASAIPDSSAPSDIDMEAAVQEAVAAKDVPAVISRYQEALKAGAQLMAQTHLDAGKAAAVQGNNPLAVGALKAAAASPDDPCAPKALVLLARVFGERLQDPVSAERLYKQILQRYPGSEAAGFAQQKLAKG